MGNIKKIAVTMGEPGGVGPEVIVKSFYRHGIRKYCNPVVIGSPEIMRAAVNITGLPLRVKSLARINDSEPGPGLIEVIEVKSRLPARKGAPSKGAGTATVKYIKKAVELALKKKVDAIVTAPISKASLKLAGYAWPGHTELLADLTDTKKYAMMFFSERLKVILATIHIPLKRVPGRISRSLIYETIKLSRVGTDMLGINEPKIAVAGLNPHAGEAGIMGEEEIKSIIPAIEAAQQEGIDVSGPYPPDVVFHRMYNGDFDMIVCMYHDQGLIPFKMLAFETGVNMTVGLPIIRTSPDHGTGFDISWKNRANPSSMIEAIKLASKLTL